MDEQNRTDAVQSQNKGGPDSNEQQAIDDMSLMEQYLSDPAHDYRNLKYGDSVDGTIVRVDRDELLVDVGSKSEGVVPTREMTSLPPDERAALQVGDTLLVTVVQPEDSEGRIVLSIDKARQEKSWTITAAGRRAPTTAVADPSAADRPAALAPD